VFRYLLILFSITTSIANSYAAGDRLSKLPYDWVPYEEISLDIQNTVAPYCSGKLIEPDWPGLHKNRDNPLSNIKIKAKQLSEDEDRNYNATGNVLLSQGQIQLEAGNIIFNPLSTNGTFEGDIRLRFPGTAIESTEGSFHLNSRSVDLVNSTFVLHEQNYTGTALNARIRGTDYSLTKAIITPCNPLRPTWSLATNTLKVDHKKGNASAKHARLNVLGVPVLYMPYISFPIDDRRQTGLLAPTIELGLGKISFESLAFPFYWNIAPQFDKTITPKFKQFHGWLLQDETRYLGKRFYGQLDLASTLNNERWLVQYDHQHTFKDQSNLTIRWLDYSDSLMAVDFKNDTKTTDFSNKEISLQQSKGSRSYYINIERWDLIPGFKTLSDLPYSSLPKISISNNNAKMPNLNINWDLEVANFYRYLSDEQLSSLDQINGDTSFGWRESIFAKAEYKAEVGKMKLTPAAEIGFASYQLEAPGIGRPENTHWIVPRTSLDMTYSSQLGDSSNWLNILTPRAKFVYAPYTDQYSSPTFDSNTIAFNKSQLFSNTRFSGKDRYGDMNRINLGLTHRANNLKGPQSITSSIGQIVRIQPEKLGLTQDIQTNEQNQQSPVFGNIDLTFNPELKLNMIQNWNTIEGRFELQSYTLAYRSKGSSLLNLGFTHEWAGTDWQDDLHFSAILPIFTRWGLATAMDYDYNSNRLEDTLIGIEYDGCCWNLRLLGKFEWTDINESIPTQNSFYLQLYLKGLGHNNDILDELLSQRIPGYQGRLYQ